LVAQQWSRHIVQGDVDGAWPLLYPGTLDPKSGDPINSANDLSRFAPGLVDRFRPGASPDTVIHGTPVGHVHWVEAATRSGTVERRTLVLLVDDGGTPSVLTDVQVIKVFASGVEQVDLDFGGPLLQFASAVPGLVVNGDVPAPLTDPADLSPGYAVVGASVVSAWAEWLPQRGPNQHGVARFSQSRQRGLALLVAVVYEHGGFLYAVTPVLIDS